MKAPSLPLQRYLDKRTPGHTPEPFEPSAVPTLPGPLRFVVQKHAASHTHYDFRLEIGGVLVSWAVPKGPSLDPTKKRLAIHVDDHPLAYLDFEGVIPEGQYGAGAVIVWDRGVWSPQGDAEKGLDAGKIVFTLHGYKLSGRWVLVRIRNRGRRHDEWLLEKARDDAANARDTPDEHSIYSGLLVEERSRDSAERLADVHTTLVSLHAPKRTVNAQRQHPTLCHTIGAAFSNPKWLFELKYDGYRAIAEARDGRPLLRYREGGNATALYPEVRRALELLPCESCVLDGELVVFDQNGHPNFGLLQARGAFTRAHDIERARRETPATYVAFDLLELDGWDLRTLPLHTRKSLLRQVVPALGPIKYCEHIDERGEEFFAHIEERDLEGMIAKRKDAPYSGTRDPAWLKLPRPHTGEFAIVGYSHSKSQAGQLGALHLARLEGSQWRYAGKVGSGLVDSDRRRLRTLLDALPSQEYAFATTSATDVWVSPRYVARVRYLEWTEGKRLRQAVFVGLGDAGLGHNAPSEKPAAAAVIPSHLDKIFWPADGFTKGDLLDYYERIAPWLLPYLRDRPLVLTRFPDGIEGKRFFQRSAPTWVPDWVQTRTVWSEQSQRDIRCFVCNDIDSLRYFVNLGTIEMHLWSSRIETLDRPDWCILDLDPKGAPWTHVRTCARAIHALCNDIGLPSYLKTSGSSGLHVLIPLGAQCTHSESRNLADILVRVLLPSLSEIATSERTLASRRGKVYLDWLQNQSSQLLCAPFSVRALARAPVSMPLRWPELGRIRDSRHYSIRSAPRRMRQLGTDPCLGVLQDRPDVLAALALLKEKLAL